MRRGNSCPAELACLGNRLFGTIAICYCPGFLKSTGPIFVGSAPRLRSIGQARPLQKVFHIETSFKGYLVLVFHVETSIGGSLSCGCEVPVDTTGTSNKLTTT